MLYIPMFISNVMRRGEGGGGLPCSAQIVLKVYFMTVSKCVSCLYVCMSVSNTLYAIANRLIHSLDLQKQNILSIEDNHSCYIHIRNQVWIIKGKVFWWHNEYCSPGSHYIQIYSNWGQYCFMKIKILKSYMLLYWSYIN